MSEIDIKQLVLNRNEVVKRCIKYSVSDANNVNSVCNAVVNNLLSLKANNLLTEHDYYLLKYSIEFCKNNGLDKAKGFGTLESLLDGIVINPAITIHEPDKNIHQFIIQFIDSVLLYPYSGENVVLFEKIRSSNSIETLKLSFKSLISNMDIYLVNIADFDLRESAYQIRHLFDKLVERIVYLSGEKLSLELESIEPKLSGRVKTLAITEIPTRSPLMESLDSSFIVTTEK